MNTLLIEYYRFVNKSTAVFFLKAQPCSSSVNTFLSFSSSSIHVPLTWAVNLCATLKSILYGLQQIPQNYHLCDFSDHG
jgi:hypothetical protein